MSVLKTQRTISSLEYVYCFIGLYEYFTTCVNNLPQRRRYISEPVANIMNTLSIQIQETANDYYQYGAKLKDNPETARKIINRILRLQKPLLAWWNTCKTKTNQMKHIVDELNREIRLIANIAGGITLTMDDQMFILNKESMKNVNFLNKMGELHNIIHTKCIGLKQSEQYTRASLIQTLVDEALYRVVHANLIMPKDHESYHKRIKDLSLALECLRQMQQPILSLFNVVSYSNKTMITIAGLINDEINLIHGVMKSDKNKYQIFE